MAASGWQVLHAIAGRLRLRIEKVRHNPLLAQQLQRQIAVLQGVSEVQVSPRTGSVLIIYDPVLLKALRPGASNAAQRQAFVEVLLGAAEILGSSRRMTRSSRLTCAYRPISMAHAPCRRDNCRRGRSG